MSSLERIFIPNLKFRLKLTFNETKTSYKVTKNPKSLNSYKKLKK